MDEAEDAIFHHDWDVVRDHAQSVLALDPGNLDGTALIEAVERAVGSLDDPTVTPTSLGVPQAERRQLTVMFCDLQGSTALSQKLDPEVGPSSAVTRRFVGPLWLDSTAM